MNQHSALVARALRRWASKVIDGREELDARNHFAVVDYDTGWNLGHTLAPLVEIGRDASSEALSRALRATRMESRGNSGEMVSTVLTLLAVRLDDARGFDEKVFAAWLHDAGAGLTSRSPAPGALGDTFRAAATAAGSQVPLGWEPTVYAAAEAARRRCDESVRLIPQQHEAGVPDAGSTAVAWLLESFIEPEVERPGSA